MTNPIHFEGAAADRIRQLSSEGFSAHDIAEKLHARIEQANDENYRAALARGLIERRSEPRHQALREARRRQTHSAVKRVLESQPSKGPA
jgi:hypothetical protein